MDWTKFTRQIPVKTTSANLYGLWATQQGIEAWFLKSATYKNSAGETRGSKEFIQAGDDYSWSWHNWESESKGKVLEANGNNRILFDFAQSKVLIELIEEGSQTICSLSQYDIPTDEKSKMDIYYGCGCGWTFWLTNLKAYVEHGILLNNKSGKMMTYEQGCTVVNM